MLEYNLNDMTLSESECIKITSRFVSTIKNKAFLARTAPGALLYTKEAYNVCNLWDRQLQMHSSNLLSRLNDKRIWKIQCELDYNIFKILLIMLNCY